MGKKEIKLFAIDLDGTLLNSNKDIPPENIEAVRRVLDAGIRVVIATGRPYNSLLPYKQQLGLDDYTIATGGARILDADGNIVCAQDIPIDMADRIAAWAEARGIHWQTYEDGGIYWPRYGQYAQLYEDTCRVQGSVKPSLAQCNQVWATKLLCIDEPAIICALQADASSLFPDARVLLSQADFLEFHNPAVSKGIALEWVAGNLGIARENICAIGDTEIDIPMLRYAGLGIAMDGADRAVKDAADVLTGGLDTGGFAQAVHKYILGETHS